MARRTLIVLFCVLAAVGTVATGCSDGDSSSDRRPSIVVTHAVLGSVVEDLVGDAADVRVLMPSGADPHDFQPSAKDIAALRNADLVVTNGLGLEESLDDALRQAQADGTAVFTAGDHVEVRRVAGAADPHFWTDPNQMRTVVAALATAVDDELGIDMASRAEAADKRLGALDGSILGALAHITASRRKLVTGHESMGYFARAYGFELVDTVVPGLSTQAGVSASQLAELKNTIARERVPVVFIEAGTPRQVTDAIADETGVSVVEIPSHSLPDAGSYDSLMRETATRIAEALR